MTKPTDLSRDRLIRMPEIVARTGLHKMTIHRRAAAGTFPGKVRLGPNSIAFYASEFEAWLADPMGWRAAGQAA